MFFFFAAAAAAAAKSARAPRRSNPKGRIPPTLPGSATPRPFHARSGSRLRTRSSRSDSTCRALCERRGVSKGASRHQGRCFARASMSAQAQRSGKATRMPLTHNNGNGWLGVRVRTGEQTHFEGPAMMGDLPPLCSPLQSSKRRSRAIRRVTLHVLLYQGALDPRGRLRARGRELKQKGAN